MKISMILFFVILASGIAFVLVSPVIGVLRWRKNNKAPVLKKNVSVISKRTEIRASIPGTANVKDYFMSVYTQDDEIMELLIPAFLYADLFEGEKGKLTFQGTRFLGFERSIK